MSTTYEDKINQMYDSQLTSQKEQLKTDYETTLSNMDAQQAAAQKALNQKIRDTRVDSQKAAVNDAEYYAAAGLSSGAKAQARLSRENQLLANLSTLRAAQQESDAEVERQRTLLAKEYASAIQQAQSANDLARAQALYDEAKSADAQLLAKQEAAANLMAQTGDYSRIGALYGLSDAEVKKLSGASSGSTGNTGTTTRNWDNQGISKAKIKEMQNWYGTKDDGYWGRDSTNAADGRSAKEAWDYYLANKGDGAPGDDETGEPVGKSNYVNIASDCYALKKAGEPLLTRLSYLEDARKAGYISFAEYIALKPLV